MHHLREVSEEEESELRTVASSRTHAYRMVQRAKLVVSMLDDKTLTATQAAHRQVSNQATLVRVGSNASMKRVSQGSPINRKVVNRASIQMRCGVN